MRWTEDITVTDDTTRAEQFAQAMRSLAGESATLVGGALDATALPRVPGLKFALADGIDVLDVGCGSGGAVLQWAREYPASRFTGYDLSEDAIAWARTAARWAELTNARFEQLDVSEITECGAYDVVFAGGGMTNPERAMARVHRVLKPGGLFFLRKSPAWPWREAGRTAGAWDIAS